MKRLPTSPVYTPTEPDPQHPGLLTCVQVIETTFLDLQARQLWRSEDTPEFGYWSDSPEKAKQYAERRSG